MSAPSRRDVLSMMIAAAVLPGARLDLFSSRPKLPRTRALRVRTITAGVGLRSTTELQRVETAIAMLERAKRAFEGEDYEVQTIRIATPPLLAGSSDRSRNAAMAQLRALDDLTASRGVMLSIGPGVLLAVLLTLSVLAAAGVLYLLGWLLDALLNMLG